MRGSAKLDQEIGRITQDLEDSLDDEDMYWIGRSVCKDSSSHEARKRMSFIKNA